MGRSRPGTTTKEIDHQFDCGFTLGPKRPLTFWPVSLLLRRFGPRWSDEQEVKNGRKNVNTFDVR